jgi:C-terminal processing protease CtpA/Prc
MLAIQEGFPTVHGVVPGSPLAQSGVRVGDQIFQAQEGNAAPRTLYGSELSSAINLLRGEPGTTVTLRLLRKNAESGRLEEHVVPVTRAQIYLDEKALPPRFIPVKD